MIRPRATASSRPWMKTIRLPCSGCTSGHPVLKGVGGQRIKGMRGSFRQSRRIRLPGKHPHGARSSPEAKDRNRRIFSPGVMMWRPPHLCPLYAGTKAHVVADGVARGVEAARFKSYVRSEFMVAAREALGCGTSDWLRHMRFLECGLWVAAIILLSEGSAICHTLATLRANEFLACRLGGVQALLLSREENGQP
jgi:hypothetical protein